MHELATRNQDGKLTVKEKHELENYRRVRFLLDLMHSKARARQEKKAGSLTAWPPTWPIMSATGHWADANTAACRRKNSRPL